MDKNFYYQSADKKFLYSYLTGRALSEANLCKSLYYNKIIYTLDGSARYYIEGGDYYLSKDDLLIISNNELSRPIDSSDNYAEIKICFEKDFLPFERDNCDLLKAFLRRQRGHNNLITNEISCKYGFREYLARIEKLCKEKTPESEILIKCLLTEIIISLNKVHKTGATANASEYNNAIRDVIRYINDNLSGNLSLDSITSTLYLTKTYLCHIFKKKTGMTIIQYITNKRILLADDLIRSGLPALEACMKSGFNNYSNFYKSYIKVMGHSPTG